MRLCLNVWKAVEEYRVYVEKVVTAVHKTSSEREEMLTLESFAIWLQTEFPRFVEVGQ